MLIWNILIERIIKINRILIISKLEWLTAIRKTIEGIKIRTWKINYLNRRNEFTWNKNFRNY